MTLEIRGGTVVTSLDPPSVLSSADVLIEDGRIVSVGEGANAGDEVIDATDALVIPGNVCAHHHLYSALARGMPYRLEPPTTFVEILRRIWWRLDRALTPDDIWWSACVGAGEALLSGTTTVVDHHASPSTIHGSLEQVLAGVSAPGARSILAYEVTDRDGLDRAAEGLEEHRRFAKDLTVTSTLMVGAHASFTLSDETLRACVALANELDVGLHLHVAEDLADQTDALARTGRRVVERLADAGALTDRTLLAHCVHVDDDEAATIRDAGAWVAHNARSNMSNRVGRAPLGALGGNVALGTDGIDGDVFGESKVAYWRAHEEDASVQPSWILERVATSARFAATAFDEPLLGRLEAGAPADAVILGYDAPSPISAENLASHWLYGISASDVRDVVVAGEVVVRDRHLLRIDEPSSGQKSRAAAERLWERMDAIGEHPFEPIGAR
ncbi:MAG TPA: amidohydrolase family protein [Actinomycetota bacterium]|nr:amidohydrolase family protein [Actinomycetota bacterium]